MVFDEVTLKRFWSKVDKRGPDDCWEWKGCFSGGGYGIISIDKKNYGAHRYSLELNTQTRPANMFALHSCDNTKCVNPNHLRWGTHYDNLQDKIIRGRKYGCNKNTYIPRKRKEMIQNSFVNKPKTSKKLEKEIKIISIIMDIVSAKTTH